MGSEGRAQRSTPKKSREERIASMDKDILDVEGAAMLLGVSSRTIYNLVRMGDIPTTRVGYVITGGLPLARPALHIFGLISQPLCGTEYSWHNRRYGMDRDS
jgi:excisionase family DNA binding protein